MGIEVLYANSQYKVLLAEIAGGQRMPTHYATSDAFVTVLEGEAEIIFSEKEESLPAGTNILIPKRKPHALQVNEYFKAMIVIAGDATLEYANPMAEKVMAKATA